MNYEQKVNTQSGGRVIDRYDLAKRNEIKKEFSILHEKTMEIAKRLVRNEQEHRDLKSVGRPQQAYKLEPQIKEDQKELIDLMKKKKALEEKLLSWDSIGEAPGETFSHITQSPGFSIGDYVGRVGSNKQRQRFTFDKYNDTYSSEFLGEGEEGSPQDLIDSIDSEENTSVKMMDILGVQPEYFDDDKEALTVAFNSNHYRHNTNAENKKTLELLITNKENNIVSIDPSKLNEVINKYLVAKAKPYTEIWTNNSGFSKIDIDINEVSLVKKNPDGDFIYKDKYLIRLFDDEILPSSEHGIPVLIGDFKNIIKFVESTPRILQQDNVFTGSGDLTMDRYIKQINPYIIDSSNDSYLLGYLKSDDTNQN